MDLAHYEEFTWRFFERHSQDIETMRCVFGCHEKSVLLFTKRKILDVVQCGECGFVYSANQPTQRCLNDFYANSAAMDLWSDIKKSDLERQKSKYAQTVEFFKQNQIKKVFDVGCGNGVFLTALRDVPGMDLSGCELSLKARNIAKFYGHKIYASSFDDYVENAYDSDKLDAVTFWGVLEHVKNPRETLQKTHKLLGENGYIVVCVPNQNSLVAQMAKEKCFTYCPQHLWYFTTDTLRRLLKEEGFEICRQFTIEPEVMPVLRMEAGLDPYDRGFISPAYITNHKAIDILARSQGYKIVMIGQRG